jgi:hypothetical protein
MLTLLQRVWMPRSVKMEGYLNQEWSTMDMSQRESGEVREEDEAEEDGEGGEEDDHTTIDELNMSTQIIRPHFNIFWCTMRLWKF